MLQCRNYHIIANTEKSLLSGIGVAWALLDIRILRILEISVIVDMVVTSSAPNVSDSLLGGN